MPPISIRGREAHPLPPFSPSALGKSAGDVASSRALRLQFSLVFFANLARCTVSEANGRLGERILLRWARFRTLRVLSGWGNDKTLPDSSFSICVVTYYLLRLAPSAKGVIMPSSSD